MTRDELLLTALLDGDASTIELAAAAGRSERAARYGLTHLMKTGLVWNPERGSWRLTEAGRAIAASISQPCALPAEPSGSDEPATLTVASAGADPQPSGTHPATGTNWTVPGWAWGLVGIVAGAVAVLSWMATLRPTVATEPTPAPPAPAGWPYTDWQSWVR